jgi:hypothetical protein
VRYQPVVAEASPHLSTIVNNIEGINMDLTVFITGIEALVELMPSVISFVNKVHPGSGQETQKATTAVALTSSVLTSVGVAASTFEQLKSGIQAAASAPTVTPTATASEPAAAGVGAATSTLAPAAVEAPAVAQASA